jgi:hypothetical protein
MTSNKKINSGNKRNLRIFYQDYDAISFESRSRDPNKSRPSWFTYERCLNNLIYSIIHSRSKFNIYFTLWYDSNDISNIKILETTQNLITQLELKGHSFKILSGDFRSGAVSAKNLTQYINSSNDYESDDLIYVCENDYLHQPNWIDYLDELIDSNLDFDYLSLYDHKDNYTLPIHQNFNSKLYYTKNHIWRTGFSTCFSKICTVSTLRKDYLTLLNYDDFFCFAMLNLFGRKLLIATPGLSTHAMINYESPAVDWESLASIEYK